jgi:hypothetical protein
MRSLSGQEATGHGDVPEDRGLAVATQRFPSGVINDYITWLVTGVAAIGAALALIVR